MFVLILRALHTPSNVLLIILSARWLVRLVVGDWVPIIGWLRGVWVSATVGDKG